MQNFFLDQNQIPTFVLGFLAICLITLWLVVKIKQLFLLDEQLEYFKRENAKARALDDSRVQNSHIQE